MTKLATYGGSRFGQIIENVLCGDPDLNRSSLAARMGLTEQTVRGWHSLGREPSFDSLVSIRKRMPQSMLLQTVRTLTEGTNLRVEIDESAEPVVSSASLGDLAQELLRSTVAVTEVLHDATRDGQGNSQGLDPVDAARIRDKVDACLRTLKRLGASVDHAGRH